MENELNEECGVLGYYDFDGADTARLLHAGLYALQHRGLQSCGIVTNDDARLHQIKDNGTAAEVFNEKNLDSLTGTIGVAHVRYAPGGDIPENAQPLVSRYCKGSITLAHNGNIITARELREELEAGGSYIPPREERERCGFRTLEEVAREADILTFHTPLDDTTRHMAGAKLFERMKPGSILINTSRGEVVDGQALRESGLQYVLDVWEHEPDLDPLLLRDALLATPHIAGYSAQGKANATALSVRTIGRYFGLSLGEWYPSNIAPSRPRAISWQELCDTIDDRFDIAAESRRLKENPEKFETIRNEYRYREEYF